MSYSIALGGDRREIKGLVRYGYEDDSVTFALITEERDSSSFREAL